MSVESYPKFYKKVQAEMGAYGKANPVSPCFIKLPDPTEPLMQKPKN